MNQTVIDYTYIQNTIWQMKALYPVIRVNRIGKSVVGRSIYAMELGRESAPALLFLGTFNGRDCYTGEYLLSWFLRVAKAVTNKEKIDGVPSLELIRRNRIVIIPFVNPDGREICERGAHCAGIDYGRIKRLSKGNTNRWNANARGVDIRYNFDFRFTNRKKQQESKGIYSPCGEGYCGPSPESEPETIAITSFCRNHRISQAVCLYPGNGSVYWRSVGCDCEVAEKQANVMGVVSGYEVEASVGCAIDSGFRNWFCAAFHKPAFDIMVYPTKDSAHMARVYELLTLSCLF